MTAAVHGPRVTPWAVIPSPNDAELFAVQGAYLVADCLPIEDARLIAAAPELVEALEEALTLMQGEPDMSLPGSDHWLWAESASAALTKSRTDATGDGA